jgi:hypothetical protein
MKFCCSLLALLLFASPALAVDELGLGSSMQYLVNATDPGIGLTWTASDFADTSWTLGTFGVGYGAGAMIQTTVPTGTLSVYTRASFTIADASAVQIILLGVDHDDGYVAWINGVEVFRSASMPTGTPLWNTLPALHESSNGSLPVYVPRENISTIGVPALVDGANVIAIGVYNRGSTSSDLALVPQLRIDPTEMLILRGPYLQQGTPDKITVRWRTELASETTVRYGTSIGQLNQTTTVSGTRTKHVVPLTELTPDTVYFYSVGTPTQTLAGDDADHFFLTGPTVGSAKPTRILVLGDSGTGNGNAAAVRNAYLNYTGATHTDFWLMLGDNAYNTGTEAEYQAGVFDMYPSLLRSSVLWATLGNHDGISADSATQTGPYYDIFTLPTDAEAGGVASGTEAYYSFDYANVHFISLESFETDRSVGGDMITWLQLDLDQVTSDWIIAFWHHPPYTKGSHDSDTEPRHDDMREIALPILEDAGVDIVFGGHSHSYERSFLLDQHYGLSTTLHDSMLVDGGDGRVSSGGAYTKPLAGGTPHRGAVYVVAGSSGKISGGPLNHPAMFSSINELGSVVLDVDGLQMDVRFLNSSGTIRDSFTLLRAAPVGIGGPTAVRLTSLRSVAPNPFNPRTEIEVSLAYAARLQLTIYNLRGERVRTLANVERSAGLHRVIWSGDDDAGMAVASGVYLVELRAGGQVDRRKITLLR